MTRAAGSLAARYGAVLRGTGAAPALAASLLGRLALGTTGFALLLLVRETAGSYAVAGAVAAAYALSLAASAPVRARRADRHGPRGVLLECGLLHPAVLVALVLLAQADAPTAVLVVAGICAGATVPPLAAVMRALWGELVPDSELPTAYSLEAVVIELCFLGGPLLVAGLTALAGPAAAVLVGGALVLSGSLWLAATPALRAVVPRARTGAGTPLASPAVRALLLGIFFVGVGFGAVEVALPAYSESRGSGPGVAGVLLAVFSAGSIVGGLAYGAVRLPAGPARQLPALVLALAVGTALPAVVGSAGVIAMGVVLVLYGLTIAPISTCNTVLLGAAAPPGTATEAFAWSTSMIFGGVALGSALGGVLVDASGARGALLLVAASGLATLVVTLGGRSAVQGRHVSNRAASS